MLNTASTSAAPAVEGVESPREYRRAVWELQEAERLVDHARDRLRGLEGTEAEAHLRRLHRGLGRGLGLVVREASREGRSSEVSDLVVGARPWLRSRIAEGGAL